MGYDWTANFRSCDSVEEYLLLGECLDGACGHNWLTWGNPEYHDDFGPPHKTVDGLEGARVEPSAPHAVDRWQMEEVSYVSKWQLSRFASDVADCDWNSYCISFRRGA